MNQPKKAVNLLGACVIALVFLFASMLGGCGKNDAPVAPKPTPVRVAHASNGPAVPPIDTNGIVVTKDEMRLSFKTGGLVRKVYVQEGDVVKAGQRLAEIELTEVGAQVEQARQLAEKASRDLKRGENLWQILRMNAALKGREGAGETAGRNAVYCLEIVGPLDCVRGNLPRPHADLSCGKCDRR
jgi:multidrug efflux pump subunit AcrA (membrane-fusion protein)